MDIIARAQLFEIGVDVDEVLADFQGAGLEIANEAFGTKKTILDLEDWGFFEHFTDEEQAYLRAECEQPGFCSSLRVLPGAQEGIRRLREIGRVFIVTSPFTSHTWVSEREWWLKKHFGFAKDDLIHTSAKYKVDLDAFLDDRPKNVVQWSERYPSRLAMLWPLHNTRQYQLDKYRVKSWDDVITRVRVAKEAQDF
jgi:5'(3')-deoxyribonucleotidase